MGYKFYALVVAGGTGSRMGGDIAKQFQMLDDKPVLHHTIEKFFRLPFKVDLTVVLPGSCIDYWREYSDQCIVDDYNIIAGGFTRFHSVKNGILYLANRISDTKTALIAVHDGVRPFVDSSLIERVYKEAAVKGAVVPSLIPTDSIRVVDSNCSRLVDRESIRIVQTPQVFRADILMEAYEQTYSPKFTDDSSVVEYLGREIFMTRGDLFNIKLTVQTDMELANAILSIYRKRDNL